MSKVSTTDPATVYATQVLSGEIVACEDVRLACERFFRDMEAPHLVYDEKAAQRMLAFCEDVCTVTMPDTRAIVPFKPLPWQAFIFSNIYGWKVRDKALDPLERETGARRFRTCYIETGKGSGKSPMTGAALLYGLIADNETTPEIYICARTSEQALIPWRDIRDMIMANPDLAPNPDDRDNAGLCEIFGGAKEGRITCPLTGGFIRTVAHHSDGAGISGPRPHVVLVEEYHEHSTDLMREMLDDGKKGRLQPLTLIITNAGAQRIGPCWEEHMLAQKVLRQLHEADDYFCIIYGVDEEDDEINDRDCWVKANPSLGSVIRTDYLLSQISKSKGSRAKLDRVRRLNFTRWPDAGGEWLDWNQWRRAEVAELPPDPWLHENCDLYLGIDLGARRDLTAIAYCWHHREKDKVYLRVRYWTPADTLADRARLSSAHLVEWSEEPAWDPYIHAVPGNTLNYSVPADTVMQLQLNHGIYLLSYDRYHWNLFLESFDAAGFVYYHADPHKSAPGRERNEWNPPGTRDGLCMTDHPQGYVRPRAGMIHGLHMPTSIERFEDRILADPAPTIEIEVNPVLRWNLMCTVVQRNPQGARKFDKNMAEKRYNQGKIDGIIACTMAVGSVNQEWPEPGGVSAHFTDDAMDAWYG